MVACPERLTFSTAMIDVINFVVLAGGRLRDGFFAYNIFPVDASSTTTELDRILSAKEFADSSRKMLMTRGTINLNLFLGLFFLIITCLTAPINKKPINSIEHYICFN